MKGADHKTSVVTVKSTPRSLAGMNPHSALSSNLPHNETPSLSEPVTHAVSENSKRTLREFEVKHTDGPPITATPASNLDWPGSSHHDSLLQGVDRILHPTDSPPTQLNNVGASDSDWEFVNRPRPNMDKIKASVGAERKNYKIGRFLCEEGSWVPNPDYYEDGEEKSLESGR